MSTADSTHARRVLVFTATYDEGTNIGTWMERVRAAVPEADVLIIDDSSPDGTGDLVAARATTDQHIHLISREGKLGLGSAHKAAFAHALDGGYDVLITMDADLSHEPEAIPAFLDAVDHADFVIGTRWGAGTCDYRGLRRAVSWAGNALARTLLRAPVSEYTTSFRAFDRRALEVLVESPPADDGYAFFVDVVMLLYRSGLVLAEVPINFRDRAGGVSKIPKAQIIVSSGRLIEQALRRR